MRAFVLLTAVLVVVAGCEEVASEVEELAGQLKPEAEKKPAKAAKKETPPEEPDPAVATVPRNNPDIEAMAFARTIIARNWKQDGKVAFPQGEQLARRRGSSDGGPIWEVTGTLKFHDESGTQQTDAYSLYAVSLGEGKWKAARLKVGDRVTDFDEALLRTMAGEVKQLAEEQKREREMAERQAEIERRTAERARKREQSFRTWTDATGQFKIEARMAGYIDGQVTLEKRDGSETVLPIEKLSAADQQFILSKGR